MIEKDERDEKTGRMDGNGKHSEGWASETPKQRLIYLFDFLFEFDFPVDKNRARSL